MDSADVVRITRDRLGLTQSQLSDRTGVPRETIARWESRRREPSLATLRDLVADAGLDLTISIAEADPSLVDLVRDQLALPPRGRLESLLPKRDAEGAWDTLTWLTAAPVQAVVIGSVAAALQGAPQRPEAPTVEVVASDERPLVNALDRDGFEPIESARRWAESNRRWEWKRGRCLIALADDVPGSRGFADLRRAALRIDVGGSEVSVAHPRDLLRLAEASGTASERARIPSLRALLLVDNERRYPGAGG